MRPRREIDLLAKVDPTNYTLTILRSKLDAQRKTLDEEQQKQLDQQRQARSCRATEGDCRTRRPLPRLQPIRPLADKAAQEQAALAAQQKAKQEEAARVAKTAAVRPAASDNNTSASATVAKRVMPSRSRTIRPRYPATALRNNQEGWVDAAVHRQCRMAASAMSRW